MTAYDAAFYRELDRTAEPSARRIIPLLLELAPIQSVIDVGCGDGGWLAAFQALGVGDICGIDGPWIKEEQLKIPPSAFRRAALDQPLPIARPFDLAMSLEVAEHLPEAAAKAFAGELARLAPMVLFSAALPGQGGLHHVNEQWPAYWAELFAGHGFRCIDCLRQLIWNDGDIAWWYRQNILLFARPDFIPRHPGLARAAAAAPQSPLAMVHPDCFRGTLRQAQPGFRRWLKAGPAALRRSLRSKKT